MTTWDLNGSLMPNRPPRRTKGEGEGGDEVRESNEHVDKVFEALWEFIGEVGIASL